MNHLKWIKHIMVQCPNFCVVLHTLYPKYRSVGQLFYHPIRVLLPFIHYLSIMTKGFDTDKYYIINIQPHAPHFLIVIPLVSQ